MSTKFKITLNKDEDEDFDSKIRAIDAKGLTFPEFRAEVDAYLEALQTVQQKERIRNRKLQTAALQAWHALRRK